MVNKLKDAGHILFDEQEVQTVIYSLSNTWEHMKMHLTHNIHIQSMEDAMCHLELEKECLRFSNLGRKVYMAGSSSQDWKGTKHKHQGGNQ